MPIISLPRILGWMKKRTWKADVWNRLYNIEQLMGTNQTELIEIVRRFPDSITRIRIYTVGMPVANREYSQLLPNETKSLEIQTRSGAAFRLSTESGRVGPIARPPYWSVPANTSWSQDKLFLENTTLYFASGTANQTAEIIVGT